MKIEEEKTCINCNYFFPYFVKGPTEEGICLNDPVFEPYIDELLENQNYKICLDLVKSKKFNGNDNTCEKFEMAEIFEEDIVSFNNEDEKISMEAVSKILKNKSIDEYRIKLMNEDKNLQIEALNGLSILTIYKNKEAIKLMNEYFKSIPPPESLEEVHHKMNVLTIISKGEINREIIKTLVTDLKYTKSNNTTRQWISEILKELSSNKNTEIVKQSLQKLPLGQFSYKLRKKIENIIYGVDYEIY